MGINRLLHSAEKTWNLSSSFSGDQVSAIWITSPPMSSDHESLVELASTLYYLSSFNTSYIFSEMMKFSPKNSNNKIWRKKEDFEFSTLLFFWMRLSKQTSYSTKKSVGAANYWGGFQLVPHLNASTWHCPWGLTARQMHHTVHMSFKLSQATSQFAAVSTRRKVKFHRPSLGIITKPVPP